ncbi:hypothetical protein [Sphingomonas sp.]|uniref:hypothetical protein n=1 Tax=Sphingomonas sp. TaxID=28214 RepID=UPI003AFFC10A
MTDETTLPRPTGEYAIVECLGHRTLVGRTSEIERFGTKMLSIEPIWKDELLPPVLVGGSSLYAFTPCSAEAAFKRQAKSDYDLPLSLRATLPAPALPAPNDEGGGGHEPEFSSSFRDRKLPGDDDSEIDSEMPF